MRAILLLAVKDLFIKRGLALVMALLFGTCFGTQFTISCYKGNLEKTFGRLSQNWLVVQQSSGVGEIHGSRLSTEVKDQLLRLGYENPIPEIHQVVGASYATGMLMRGVAVDDYSKITPFLLLSGEAIKTGDPPRYAMVGKTLAELEKVDVGDPLRIRGRDFSVIGIFQTKTYQDNEVWISLSDAQRLLNYGEDVSVFFIPDGGVIKEGVDLGNGISVGRKGETARVYGNEISSFYDFLGMVSVFAGIAMLITLSNLIWRISWLHRHEFGILRTLGFGNHYLEIYIFIQAVFIFLMGLVFGMFLSFTVVISVADHIPSFGLSVDSSWDWTTYFYWAGFFFVVLLMGIALPMLRIKRTAITSLLGRE